MALLVSAFKKPRNFFSAVLTYGLGFRKGAGGAVTQITTRSTGVTLNRVCGTITTDTTSLAAGAEATFVVTNSKCSASDVPIVAIVSGSTTSGATDAYVSAVAEGSFTISYTNLHAATAETGALVINFALIRTVNQ
jgi:ribosomal protein S9